MMTLKEELEALEGITLSIPVTYVIEDCIEIYIEADENDGDYVNETTKVDIPTMLKLIPIAKKVMNRKSDKHRGSYNWGSEGGDYLSDREVEDIEDFVPFDEYDSIHTIEEIKFTLKLTTGETYIINY